jgi:TetR/AcrR family transcriptional regulator, transcriptional repressor for nem operon
MTNIIHTGYMGHSQDEKTRNHDRIVDIAAKRIREAGTDGPGVAEIMAEAGLTHGGFYKHFASRDDLVVAAVDRALADGEGAMAALTAGSEDPLGAFVDWYTSTEHRDDPAHGCAVVALGGDVPRAGGPVRAAYHAQVERYLHRLAELIGSADEPTRRAAVTSLSALVGAVLVARAVGDDDLSAEILGDVRAAVVEQSFA